MNINWEYLLVILSTSCTVVAAVISYYLYVKKLIESNALDAINKAENTDLIAGEKMVEAVNTIYEMLPTVVKPFINKVLIETVIQGVFNKVEEYAKKQVDKNTESDDATL